MPQPTGMRSHLPLGNRSRWTACHIPSIHFLWKWRRALYFSPWFPRRPNLQGHDESCKLSLVKRPYHGQPWAEHSETLISESKNLNRWNGGSRRRSPELSWMPQQHEVLVTPKRGVALLYFQLGESMRSLYFTQFCTQWSLQSIDVTTPSQHVPR